MTNVQAKLFVTWILLTSVARIQRHESGSRNDSVDGRNEKRTCIGRFYILSIKDPILMLATSDVSR